MIKLFIGTYNQIITLAILKEGKLLCMKEHTSERSHSKKLIPLLDEVLKEANFTAKDLKEIIVINGPGSFTGVRLGVTVAKTLAYTLDIGVKTISSIEAIGVSDNSLNKKIVSIPDPKGFYYGFFENNTLVGEISYSHELPAGKQVDGSYLDVEKIDAYLKGAKALHAHAVKALYIKTIEVQNG